MDVKKVDKVDPKRVLELFGVPHTVATNEFVVVEGNPARALQVDTGNLHRLAKRLNLKE